MDHDRNKVRCNQNTDIEHAFWQLKIIMNRLKTPDVTNQNGLILFRRDQIQMLMDEVPTEEVAS